MNIPQFKIPMEPGTWVKAKYMNGQFSFKHHGIVSEVDRKTEYPTKIIHYCAPETIPRCKNRWICETSVKYFLENAVETEIVDEEPNFSFAEVVIRAKRLLYKGQYELQIKNCEQFASQCYLGTTPSFQLMMTGIAAIVAIAVIAIHILLLSFKHCGTINFSYELHKTK